MPKRLVHPFRPIVGDAPTILILGSFPSVGSVSGGGYYGHPRNAFWRILAESLGPYALSKTYFDSTSEKFWTWRARYRFLRYHGVALWDVARRVDREGRSSDASLSNVVPNKIISLLARERTIRTIIFSGQTAYRLFESLVLSDLRVILPNRSREIRLVVCPSTSGAHAISYRRKLVVWRRALRDGARR